jgi:hypothetical protein
MRTADRLTALVANHSQSRRLSYELDGVVGKHANTFGSGFLKSNRVSEPVLTGGQPTDQLQLLGLCQMASLDSFCAIPMRADGAKRAGNLTRFRFGYGVRHLFFSSSSSFPFSCPLVTAAETRRQQPSG